MVDVQGTLDAAKNWFTGIPWSTIFMIFLGIVIIAIGIGIVWWWVLNRARYNQVLVTFQRIGGELRPLGRHLAMTLTLTRMGDKVLVVKKTKKCLQWPLTFMGKNVSWWEVLPTGDWQNFGIKVNPYTPGQVEQMILERDSRLIKSQTDKLMEKRFENESWWAKNKEWVIQMILFIIAGGLMAWILTKSFQVIPSLANAAQALKEAAQALANVKAMTNGGTSLVPA